MIKITSAYGFWIFCVNNKYLTININRPHTYLFGAEYLLDDLSEYEVSQT